EGGAYDGQTTDKPSVDGSGLAAGHTSTYAAAVTYRLMVSHLSFRFSLARNGFLTEGLTLSPYGTAHKKLFLPDGHCTLQGVDCVPAGLECRGAMRRNNGNQNARFADFQAPEAMHDRKAPNRKLLPDLSADFTDFGPSHGFVSFVFQVKRLLAFEIIWTKPSKTTRAPSSGALRVSTISCVLMGFRTSRKTSALRSSPPLTGGRKATSS